MLWPAAGIFPSGQSLGKNFRAWVIETHAIDNSFVRDGAKNSRLWISRLRMPRYAAEFAKAEAEFFPNRNDGGKFIHSGSKPDRIWKLQTKKFNEQFRRREKISNCGASEFAVAG